MKPINIGTRTELFVDDFLVDQILGLEFKLHEPQRREVVLELNQAAEGPVSGYYNVLKADGQIRMYYRGYMPLDEKGGTSDTSPLQTANVAISSDGIRFERPKLGLHDFKGSRENNVVHVGKAAHNLFVFLDENPNAKPDERFKAVGGEWENLHGYVSPDGFRWRPVRDEALNLKGTFDSLNVIFWDKVADCYRSFSRDFLKLSEPAAHVRLIQSATSKDFINWTEPVAHVYHPSAPLEQYYTNATVRCPGAEHHLLSFPKRFADDRKKVESHPYTGLSDAKFMSSRDGVNWDRRFMQAWLRPGRDPLGWTDRTNMPAQGIVQTADDEFSMYVSEHCRQSTNRVRRLSIRRHGFASINSKLPLAGEFVTKPLIFSGRQLVLNYATSAAGFVRVELQDVAGRPIPGFKMADATTLYGDELDAIYSWKGGSDLSKLIGRPVRMHFSLWDADLFAIRTA